MEYSSDRYIILDTQDLGTISSCTQKSVTLDLTWSLSGNTGISHLLISDSTSSPPSWISLNSSTGVLSMTTPNLTAAASYQFYVKSEVSGDSNVYQNLIKLTVDKYVYVKRQFTNEVKANTYSTQAVMAVGVAFWSVSSFMSFSSPQAIWMIANQFQLMLLLPLTGAFIPEDVVNYFTGGSFTNFNFDFIPTIKSPVGISLKDFFGDSLNSDSLANLGATYKWWLLNHISLITMIIVWVTLHLLSFLPKLWMKNNNKDKWTYKLYSKWMNLLTFTIYVRMFIEAFQAMLVSSLTEIKLFNTNNAAHRLSLSVAFLIAFFCWGIIVMMLVEWIRSRNQDTFKQQTYFSEIFGGLKDRWVCRSYLLLNFGRRAFFIIICVFGPSQIIGVIVPFNVIQVLYFVAILWIRPLEAKTDTLIDLSNEWFFTVLSLLITYYNEEPRWNSKISSVFMWTIFANILMISVISLRK